MNKQLSSWFFGRRIGLGFVLSVLVCGAGAESAQVYVDRIAADKRDIPAYIGLTEFQIQEPDQKVALKTQKRGLRYAKANGQKLALRTLGIRLWGMTGDVKKALREYKRGLRVKGSAQFPALHLEMARVYFGQRAFSEAEEMLRLSLSADAMNNDAAESLLMRLQMVERAIAVTQSDFAFAQSISRAAVAHLLSQELSVAQYLGLPKAVSVGETSDQGLTDYQGSEFAADILATHRLNLRSFRITNGAFQPEKAMMRGELALLVEDILYVKFGISRTAFIGSASPFSDLASNDTSFNAIMSAVTRGLMQGREDGSIGPQELVSGAEAILVLHSLKQILKRPAQPKKEILS
ncbi:MAG: S-layer homology domain-containing protein [Candidatus Azotimanducaceae bacterium]